MVEEPFPEIVFSANLKGVVTKIFLGEYPRTPQASSAHLARLRIGPSEDILLDPPLHWVKHLKDQRGIVNKEKDEVRGLIKDFVLLFSLKTSF